MATSKRDGECRRCLTRLSNPRQSAGGSTSHFRNIARWIFSPPSDNVRSWFPLLRDQVTNLTTNDVVHDASSTQPDLASLAQQARWQVIKTVTNAKAGHIGGPLSMMDLLVTPHFVKLPGGASDAPADERDPVVLFQGHAPPGL